MKFRFMGGQDCPDWLLAEIVVLSKITSVKTKLLVSAVVKEICGTPLDYAKVDKWTSDAKLGPDDIKALIACVLVIVTNATKYGVDGETLSQELQQLGLPKENATSTSKAYNDNASKLQAVLRADSMRLWRLNKLDWRVDYILASSSLDSVQSPTVQMMSQVTVPNATEPKVTKASISVDKFQLLISELTEAEAMMSKLTE